jgi:hypothetical protein
MAAKKPYIRQDHFLGGRPHGDCRLGSGATELGHLLCNQGHAAGVLLRWKEPHQICLALCKQGWHKNALRCGAVRFRPAVGVKEPKYA